MLDKPVTIQGGTKIFSLPSSRIGGELDLRFDFKYRYFWDVVDGNLFDKKRSSSVKIKFLVYSRPKQKIKKGIYDDEFRLIELEHIEQKTGRLSGYKEVSEIGSDKLRMSGWDLFTTRLRPYLGKTFTGSTQENTIGTTEWIPLKVNHDLVHPKILQAFLLHKAYFSVAGSLMSGKNQPRISEFDLLQLRVPKIPIEQQREIANKILSIETELDGLLLGLREPQDVIDEVFGDFLKADLVSLHSSFGKGMTAGLQKSQERVTTVFENFLSSFSYSLSLRGSSRFYRQQMQTTMNLLQDFPTIRLKHIVTAPIHKGVQDRPSENGEIPVIKTAHLKNEYIDLSNAEMVSRDFFESVRLRAEPKRGDVLMASTGKVSLGKVDVFDFDEPVIVDNHISIIRLNSSFNPYFVTYFLRTILGAFQIERDYSGTTNQIDFYPDQVGNLQIINLDRREQDLIVDKINIELGEIKQTKAAVVQKRLEIDSLIEQVI